MEKTENQPRESETGESQQNGQQQKGNTAKYLNTPTSATTVLRTSGKITGSKSDLSTMATDKTNNGEQNNKQESLVEKLRDHYQKSPKGLKASKFSFVLFHFQTTSMLFMLMTRIIPYIMQDCSEMTQYYCKIFFCYLYVMSQANWWCSLLYKSDLPDVRDKPTLDKDDWFQKPPETLKNAETIEPEVDKFGFEWKYCQLCERYKPPRSHHCTLCKKCVLRRDHHCYFIGRCVGHYNQRYFVVLTFHGVVTSLACFPVSLSYLMTLPDATGWIDYFLPNTLLNFFYYNTASWEFTLVTFQCYVLIVFFLWSGFYFTVQLSLIIEGKTLVEVAKKFDMKVSGKWTENMTMVFGDYWLLNFLFPAQLIFKQRHDGIHYENVKFFGKNDDAAK